MEINQILYGVENLEMVMPEFQREYVWSIENAKQLMVSLFKGYPTGSLLFWEAKGEDTPEIKNNAIAKDKIGLTKVILDGQQRMTTLFLMIKGEIPPYYTENDIMNDPRHLYFNLNSTEFQYYKKTQMSENPLWQNVIDCFDINKVDAIDIVEQYIEKHPEENFKDLLKIVNNNLTKLRSIEKRNYPIQTVPNTAKIDEAIDVFDRVNSKGTKLTDAELVLTHITGKWPQARRKLKEKINKLKKEDLVFNLDFLTRLMVVALTGSALFKKNSKLNYEKFTQEDYVLTWEKVGKAIDYLIPILKQDALISSTNDMNTVNVLVPIISYLLREDIKISESKKYGFLYWMFLSLIWGRYSGQTDQRLDKDVYLTINSNDPIKDLVNEIEDQRGRIKVTPSDLEGRGSGHPLYRMLYIVTKNKKAIDWSNGSTIYGTVGDYYSIHSHHIFPKSLLYKDKFSSENLLDKKKVNEIANRAFVTRDTNFEISAKQPEEYLESIEEKYPGALQKQFIPMDKSLWTIDNYESFLKQRRELIAQEINEYLQYLKDTSEKSKDKISSKIGLEDIISKGENNYVEFKSSLRWDYKTNQVNKQLEYIIAKTISAFLNTEGGQLFIGVDDDKNILGLENDYKTFSKKPNSDGFLLKLTDVINNYIGKEFHQYIVPKIETINNKEMCIIDSQQAGMPVFLKNNNKEEFFIRASASTEPMSIREAYEYINSHWNDK